MGVSGDMVRVTSDLKDASRSLREFQEFQSVTGAFQGAPEDRKGVSNDLKRFSGIPGVLMVVSWGFQRPSRGPDGVLRGPNGF